jgi:heme oxygenase
LILRVLVLNVAANLRPPAVIQLRSATDELHRRIEEKSAIIPRLSDPARRRDVIRRYAALHIPADEALAPCLWDMAGLDFPLRSRTSLLAPFAGKGPLPAFPRPMSRAEALGMLYVLEGSTLGGRLILRTLADRGIADPNLAFLDPYGAQTGARWRGFLSVLTRETGDDPQITAQAIRGAQTAFRHAEGLLCEGVP